MPNIGGSAQWKRRLLASVVESQLLYAAPVWIPSVTEVARTRAILIRPQRTAALWVIRSYRTVSDEAALVLACMPPVDLLGLERRNIGSRLRAAMEPGEQRPPKAVVKQEARKNTIVAWQARWSTTTKAAWTRRVIPDLSRWLGRTVPWVPLTFHMTQALTGHGCFEWYLHRMNRAASPRCWQCSGESDTVEHTLFDCPHWDGFREALSARIGHRPSADDVPDIICGPAFELLPADAHGKDAILREAEERFRLFYGMVENILSVKEEEERVRQAANGQNSP
uniref:Retrovirus-related Pol polyprotein from type-1 retrotransposable element R1 n=2 Tax=Schizaphis graminum TaxID=13262 RepID=A0A2S2NKA7_SCHGA